MTDQTTQTTVPLQDDDDEDDYVDVTVWRPFHVIVMTCVISAALVAMVIALCMMSARIAGENVKPRLERSRACQTVPADFRVTCIEAAK